MQSTEEQTNKKKETSTLETRLWDLLGSEFLFFD